MNFLRSTSRLPPKHLTEVSKMYQMAGILCFNNISLKVPNIWFIRDRHAARQLARSIIIVYLILSREVFWSICIDFPPWGGRGTRASDIYIILGIYSMNTQTLKWTDLISYFCHIYWQWAKPPEILMKQKLFHYWKRKTKPARTTFKEDITETMAIFFLILTYLERSKIG